MGSLDPHTGSLDPHTGSLDPRTGSLGPRTGSLTRALAVSTRGDARPHAVTPRALRRRADLRDSRLADAIPE